MGGAQVRNEDASDGAGGACDEDGDHGGNVHDVAASLAIYLGRSWSPPECDGSRAAGQARGESKSLELLASGRVLDQHTATRHALGFAEGLAVEGRVLPVGAQQLEERA
jgi:hypothetical protein